MQAKTATLSRPLTQFLFIAFVEGISMLVLVFIAMPLKYLADMPAAVKYTGWIHGILFLLYMVYLLQVWIKCRWSFGMVFLAFLASLIPFGTFWLEKKVRKLD